MNYKKIAGSLFLTAFVVGLNITGVAPVLGMIKEQYGNYGMQGIQFLQTLPYVLLTAGSLMVGWLTARFSKKKVAVAGMLLIGIFGVLPCFSLGYESLIWSRFLIGFGFGILSPLNTAFITEFFRTEERAGYLGLHVVGMGAGSIAGNFLGGVLAGHGYRYFYLVYAVAFAAMAGVWFLLPETKPKNSITAQSGKLTPAVYELSALSLLHTMFITSYSTNLAIYISNFTDNAAMLTGAATTVNAVLALLVGMFFGRLSGLLKQYTLTFSIFAAAVGLLVLKWFPALPGIYLGSACCGVSLSCFMAQCSYLISMSVEKEAVARASGVFAVIGAVGGFISPLTVGNVAGLLPGGNIAENQFLLSGLGMGALGVLVLIKTKGKQGGMFHGSHNHRR